MALALVKNGKVVQYPIGNVEVQRMFPNTSFILPLEGQDLSDYGVVTVESSTEPDYDPQTQALTEGKPKLVNDTWTQVWKVSKISDAELKARDEQVAISARKRRDQLLTESDWLIVREIERAHLEGEGSQSLLAWTEYRQALRELPSQQGFPWDITWPERP